MQDYTLDNGELYISADRKSHTYLQSFYFKCSSIIKLEINIYKS